MILFVNNKQQITESDQTLAGLLASLTLSGTKGIAVAVNQTIISRSEWDTYALNENDKITIIKATQGG